MNAVAISGIAAVCVFAGALVGTFLRTVLPDHHLSAESKDLVRLAMGLIGTMTALILGLLIASAKSSYDTQRSDLIDLSAKVVFLDRVLAHYGSETSHARERLRAGVVRTLDRIWPTDSQPPELDPSAVGREDLYEEIHTLVPHGDAQRTLKAQALDVIAGISQIRWLMFEQSSGSISMPFLVVVIVWLTLIFLSFGLFAPPNTTVVITLLVSALSVCGALFLIVELDHPFEGVVQISAAPLRAALEHLGR